MSHGDTVADGDCVEFERYSTGESDGFFDDFSDFVEFHMTWNDVSVAVGNAYERFFNIFIAETACVKEASVRSPLEPFFYSITSHYCSPDRIFNNIGPNKIALILNDNRV